MPGPCRPPWPLGRRQGVRRPRRPGAAGPRRARRSAAGSRRPQRLRQDHPAADGRRPARAQRRRHRDLRLTRRFARSPGRSVVPGGQPRSSTTTCPCSSTSSTPAASTRARSGRAPPRPSSPDWGWPPGPRTCPLGSRGLRQKTAIVLALVRPFRLLLVDEPFVGLDPPGREAFTELIDEAVAGGATVVIATPPARLCCRRRALSGLARRGRGLRRATGGGRRG